MLKQKSTSRSRTSLLVGVMVVALGVTGYALYGYFFPSAAPQAEPDQLLAPLPSADIKIEAGFLATAPFTGLRQHGQYPVSTGTIGKLNPFERQEISTSTPVALPTATSTPLLRIGR